MTRPKLITLEPPLPHSIAAQSRDTTPLHVRVYISWHDRTLVTHQRPRIGKELALQPQHMEYGSKLPFGPQHCKVGSICGVSDPPRWSRSARICATRHTVVLTRSFTSKFYLSLHSHTSHLFPRFSACSVPRPVSMLLREYYS